MKMQRALLVLPLLALGAAPAPPPEALARSRAAADAFLAELRQALDAALSAGGPAAAVEACAAIAPALAQIHSERSGLAVRRVALRVRNPASVPDAFERQALERLAEAPMAPDGRQAEIFAETEGEFRYLRAIPTQGPCLLCHGPAVAPEVRAAIAQHYPHDQAMGFREGELRGAVAIRWPRADR
ncbi:MAG: DUF3365 domain-containing protein [Sphingomonadaceae bacterium]|uniref:Tll0287-like domain-containing protein n=1 Tax=Thermaurantiacus sp. TaxID=2820283 RepID=UPI00298F1322|nr:DUF3365 domain-containing protein [Thermaurantiacus sp.]MCS6987512.1 DUF3365 domain-containing protein [Sphingomonadaceae bacterium]MDW8415113.1 DUF3365 domain-containing protein [Thermaurantiacus sp.]